MPLQGQWLCGGCKRLNLRDLERRAVVHDRGAHNAFLYAVIGSLFLQFIFQPLALIMGIRALRRHQSERGWPDRWKALTAIVISSLWFLALLILAVGTLSVEWGLWR